MASSTAGMITHHGFPRDTCLVLWGVIKMFIVLVVTTNLNVGISTYLLGISLGYRLCMNVPQLIMMISSTPVVKWILVNGRYVSNKVQSGKVNCNSSSVDGNSTISTSTFDTTRGHTHDTSMVEDSETNIGINIGNNPTTELRNNWKDHTLEKRNKVHHYFYIRP